MFLKTCACKCATLTSSIMNPHKVNLKSTGFPCINLSCVELNNKIMIYLFAPIHWRYFLLWKYFSLRVVFPRLGLLKPTVELFSGIFLRFSVAIFETQETATAPHSRCSLSSLASMVLMADSLNRGLWMRDASESARLAINYLWESSPREHKLGSGYLITTLA